MTETTTRAARQDGRRPKRGGTVTWACAPGFPPAVIFPFTPAERMGTRNILEFQALMYSTLYYFGSSGQPEVDYARSIAEPPQWSEDGLTVTVRVKPWKWSNGETLCADNVLFWVNLMKVKGDRYGEYVPGYFPDNLTDYGKRSQDTVYFTFDKAYSQRWVLMNQLSTITPLPKAWDRTAEGPANASGDPADVEAVYAYLMAEQGDILDEGNAARTRWPDSPIWSVVSGPWRLKSYTLEGVVTFVLNEHHSGPNKPYLDEFRQIPTFSDEEQYEMLQRGPRGEGAIQVGYLPLSFATEPAESPDKGGPNPLDHYRLVPQTAYCIRYISLNYNNPTVRGRLFAQPYLRQAVQLCLDQDSAVRDIYQGYAYRQNGPVPMLPRTDLVSPGQREGAWPLPFDPDRARQLLEANGWDTSVTPAVCVRPGTGPGEAGEGIPAGTPLSFLLRYVEGRPALTRLMQQLRADAAKAGIDVRLEEVYGSVLVAEDAPCEAGPDCLWEACCWNGGWVFHQPTGEILFSTGAGGNFGHWSDARADELIAKTVTTDDIQALYEYQDYIAEQVPVIFTPNFPIRLFEVSEDLHGFEPINPFGMIAPENWHYLED
ncbi:peptide/nickel transport system substrate-binding protein [Streptomyces sp. V4I8]|uniref:ABC transporter substrate-binding protein n=1 Tax=Streptomyces sp. V4I8 TaxID=3156469 RepID=UPI0035197F52